MKTTSMFFALLATALTATAGGAITLHQKNSGTDAFAQIVQSTEEAFRDWTIILSQSTTSLKTNDVPGTKPVVTSSLALSVSLNAFFADGSAEFLNGSVTPSPGSFTLQSSSASVSGVSVTVTGTHFDPEGNPTDVSRTYVVTASWAALSLPGRSSFTCNSDGFHLRSDRKSADAEFTGQVFDGGTDVIAGGTVSASIGSGSSLTFASF